MMNDTQQETSSTARRQAALAEKRATALRANLQRRKEQAKARKDNDKDNKEDSTE